MWQVRLMSTLGLQLQIQEKMTSDSDNFFVRKLPETSRENLTLDKGWLKTERRRGEISREML